MSARELARLTKRLEAMRAAIDEACGIIELGDRRETRMTHCWKDRREWIEETCGFHSPEHLATYNEPGATCLLEDGHEGPHEWTPDEGITVQRLLAADGPAGGRVPELTLAEWRRLYVLLDAARKARR
jgi:hypothetical protein